MQKQNQMSVENEKTFLFGKRNYILMAIGLALIVLGFLIMSGPEANTRPDGQYDPTFWNPDIYSWRIIRLAPFLVIAGFVVEIFAILVKPTSYNSNS